MALKTFSNIMGFPKISIKKIGVLVFEDDVPDYVRWEFDMPNYHVGKKVLGYSKGEENGQPKVRLHTFHEAHEGPQSLPLRFLAQPWDDYHPNLFTIIEVTEEVWWTKAPDGILDPTYCASQ